MGGVGVGRGVRMGTAELGVEGGTAAVAEGEGGGGRVGGARRIEGEGGEGVEGGLGGEGAEDGFVEGGAVGRSGARELVEGREWVGRRRRAREDGVVLGVTVDVRVDSAGKLRRRRLVGTEGRLGVGMGRRRGEGRHRLETEDLVHIGEVLEGGEGER